MLKVPVDTMKILGYQILTRSLLIHVLNNTTMGSKQVKNQCAMHTLTAEQESLPGEEGIQ